MASTAFMSGQGFANSKGFSFDGITAINNSVYVNTITRTAHIDTDKALSLYDFTADELEYIQSTLDILTDEQIQLVIDSSTTVSEGDVNARVAPVIVWGGIAILGMFTGAALYFSSKYMTYKEKQNLINQCYNVGGTPSIDSGDTGGLHGEPKKAWWKITSTYSFECVK